MILAWDILRFAIIAEGLLIGAAMFSVLWLHWRFYRSVKCKDPEAGLLPLHVASISLSYGIVAYALVAGVVAGLGTEGSWRLPLYFAGFAIGLFALGVMATRQRRRIRFSRPTTTVTIEEDRTTTQNED